MVNGNGYMGHLIWSTAIGSRKPLCHAGGGIQQGTIQGTCTDMCPASEIERRMRIEDISSFERMVPTRAETTTELAVKKFARNVRHTSPTITSLCANTPLARGTPANLNPCSL